MPNAQPILLGRFVPIDSPLARLDPRAKIIAAIIILVALAIPRTPLAFLPGLVLFLLAARASGVPARLFLGTIPSLAGLLAITLLFQIVFVPGDGEPLALIGPVAITAESLVRGLALSAALLLTLLFASLFTLTTSPVDIADALREGLAPLRRLRVPVEDLALVAMIALRFVPTLVEEAERIRKAQIARGLSPGPGLFGGARTLLPLLVPLVEGTFRKAEHLAVALEARGYESGAPRVAYRALRMGAGEALALLLATLAAAATAAMAAAARGAP